MTATILQGDALTVLQTLPSESVHCVVTSPPYWALRRYSAGEQEMGSEPSSEAYLAAQVAVFREVRRVLRDDGTCWVNIGDSYSPASTHGGDPTQKAGPFERRNGNVTRELRMSVRDGVTAGNLAAIPYRLGLALQADGWLWRSTIIWQKLSPMPESLAGWTWERHRVKVRSASKDSPKYDNRRRDAVGYMSTDGSQDEAQWSSCLGCRYPGI